MTSPEVGWAKNNASYHKLERVVVVGKSGAGKTTLSKKLAEKLELNHVELDGISWQPNWVNLPRPEMRARVNEAVPATSRWIADGNYLRSVRDIVWERADTLIWLDYPLRVALLRVLRRTYGRLVHREVLWNGNRESLRHHFDFNPDENLFMWTIRMHKQHRRDIPAFLEELENKQLNVLRFRTPAETEQWLRSISPDAGG